MYASMQFNKPKIFQSMVAERSLLYLNYIIATNYIIGTNFYSTKIVTKFIHTSTYNY